MSHRRAKSTPKIFETSPTELKRLVLRTMKRIVEAVGSSLGPGGKISLIESDTYGLPNISTKDGVTIFSSLGAHNAYEHLIIEQARDAAKRTSSEAGDGTTTATVLSYYLVSNLFEFCENHPKYSPQKAVRRIAKVVKDKLLPYIKERAILIGEDNKELLKMVAKISANGDEELAQAVIQCFEEVGYGEGSHVTIRQVSGDPRYAVERIDGFPIPKGLEESSGKLHIAFINDQPNQRCYLEKPLFLLYDGVLSDLMSVAPLLDKIGQKYVEGNTDFKNIVIWAHGFSDNVLTTLAFNFSNPSTINILPMVTPMFQFLNSQTHFLYDLSAFTGAKVFGLKDQLSDANLENLGSGMESFEGYRFRSTVIGDPEPINVEVRAQELTKMMENSESRADKIWLQERIGKITNGIAKLTIYGGSSGELREIHDRAEDAVLSVRSSIVYGALPGGCRVAVDMVLLLSQELEDGDPAKEVLMPSLLSLPDTLLRNAGYNMDEIKEILGTMVRVPELVYDIENEKFGKAEELGLFDATKAVQESLSNAVSIAGILGTIGAIICSPRDEVFERSEAKLDSEYDRAVEDPNQFVNEAEERI